MKSERENKVLLTGRSGFIGSEIFKGLVTNKVDVVSYGRRQEDDVFFDMKNEVDVDSKFSCVIHCAGLAHVKASKGSHHEVNYLGTKILLESLKGEHIPRRFIFLSTVAVYGLDSGFGIDETTVPTPRTPYGISKYKAEELISKWSQDNNVEYIILRIPLVVGPNPPGNLGKLYDSISKGKYIRIRNNFAKKSFVCLRDLSELILKLSDAKKDYTPGTYNVTDGGGISFSDIEDYFLEKTKNTPLVTVPYFLLYFFALVFDLFSWVTKLNFQLSRPTLKKMTSTLTFSNAKAKAQLRWDPILNFDCNRKR